MPKFRPLPDLSILKYLNVDTGYIRTDIHDEVVKALREAVEMISKVSRDLWTDQRAHDVADDLATLIADAILSKIKEAENG